MSNTNPIEKDGIRLGASERFSENISLLRKARGGDEKAVEELIRINSGLVNHIALRFTGRGTDYEDLQQIGHIGLLKAIRTFDEARGFAFSTYAVPLVFGEIRRFLRDDGPIKVSRIYKKIGATLAAEREKAIAAGENDIRIEELARRCGVNASEAVTALEAIQPVSSLSDLVYAEEDSPTVEAKLYDEDENERSFDKIAISAALDKLPDLRRKIILLRYFRDFSQEETARALGLTQVKVSREEKKILAFLRGELS